MIKKQETYKNIRNSLRKNALAIGAVAVSVPGIAAQPASAQSGGVEAPAAVTQTALSQSGGSEAPAVTTLTEADQALNLQAQHAVTNLAKRFAKLGGSNPTSESYMRDTHGNRLVSSTITVPTKDSHGHNDGEYSFNIVAKAGPNGKPQLDDVYSLTASEGFNPSKDGEPKPPEASLTIDQNPATNTWEAGGTYKLYPLQGDATSSNENYVSISAGIESIAPDVPHLTTADLEAVVYQADGLLRSAEQGQPIHMLEPAFNQQGSTINGPAN
jgi:hypothetical protein